MLLKIASSNQIQSLTMNLCNIQGCQSSSLLLDIHVNSVAFESVHVTHETNGSFVIDAANDVNISQCEFISCTAAGDNFLKVMSCTNFVVIESSVFNAVIVTNKATDDLYQLLIDCPCVTTIDDCKFVHVSGNSVGGFLSIPSASEAKITNTEFRGATKDSNGINVTNHKTYFEACDFGLNSDTSMSITAPMIKFEGTDTNSEFEFYNCCFHHNENVSLGSSSLYFGLSGEGNVTFTQVCFDASQSESVSISGESLIVDYGGLEVVMFDSCTCFAPQYLPSDEPTTAEPEDEPTTATETEDEPATETENQPLTSEEPVPPDGTNKSSKTPLIVGVVVGVLIVIAVIVVIIIFLLRRRRDDPQTVEEPPETCHELADETAPTSIQTVEDDWHVTTEGGLFTTDQQLTVPFTETFEEVIDA